MDTLNIICLQSDAFYSLLEEAVARLNGKFGATPQKWIQTEEAMNILGISSKTTLQKFRDEGRIRFSQPEKRIILYDRDSINEFLDSNSRNTF